MIIVTNVEIITVDVDHPDELYPIYKSHDPMLVNKGTEKVLEYIKGKKFIRNVHDEGILIGMTEEVQTAIGLPFKVFDDQKWAIQKLHSENITLRRKLNRIKYMSFWNKLKMLFKKELIK